MDQKSFDIVEVVRTVLDRQFESAFGGFVFTNEQRGAKCSFCGADIAPTLVIAVDCFDICPSCILAGPHATAEKAATMARSPAEITRVFGEEQPVEIEEMAKSLRKRAARFRKLQSFSSCPGGRVAVALAEALVLPHRRTGKAA